MLPARSLSRSINQLSPVSNRTYASIKLSADPSDAELKNIPAQTKLPWNDFLHLRRQRHRADVLTSIPTAFIGLFGGISYFANMEIDPSQLVLGLDPLLVYGGATIACGGLGWLVGPIFGSAAWKLVHRKKAALIDQREKEFYMHVKKNRVDPSRQSFNNPVPDHYAEKVGSVADYRRWLKDCRAYNRKANKFVV